MITMRRKQKKWNEKRIESELQIYYWLSATHSIYISNRLLFKCRAVHFNYVVYPDSNRTFPSLHFYWKLRAREHTHKKLWKKQKKRKKLHVHCTHTRIETQPTLVTNTKTYTCARTLTLITSGAIATKKIKRNKMDKKPHVIQNSCSVRRIFNTSIVTLLLFPIENVL